MVQRWFFYFSPDAEGGKKQQFPVGRGELPRSCCWCWGWAEKHGQGNWEWRRGPNWCQLPLVSPWWLKALAEGEELGYSPSPPLTGPRSHHPAATSQPGRQCNSSFNFPLSCSALTLRMRWFAGKAFPSLQMLFPLLFAFWCLSALSDSMTRCDKKGEGSQSTTIN